MNIGKTTFKGTLKVSYSIHLTVMHSNLFLSLVFESGKRAALLILSESASGALNFGPERDRRSCKVESAQKSGVGSLKKT